MQKKVRFFQLGMVTLLIIMCLVVFPAAAAASFHIPDSTRFTGYKLSDSSRAAGLISHAVARLLCQSCPVCIKLFNYFISTNKLLRCTGRIFSNGVLKSGLAPCK